MIKYYCYICKKQMPNLNYKCECGNKAIIVIDDDNFYINKENKSVICRCKNNNFTLEISNEKKTGNDLYILRCNHCKTYTTVYFDASNKYMKYKNNKYIDFNEEYDDEYDDFYEEDDEYLYEEDEYFYDDEDDEEDEDINDN